MRKEDLFEAIGNIGSETIERNVRTLKAYYTAGGMASKDSGNKNHTAGRKRKRIASWKKWTAAAASFLVFAGAGLLVYHQMQIKEDVAFGTNGTGQTEQPGSNALGGAPEDAAVSSKYVDISELLASNRTASGEALEIARIEVASYIAEYERIQKVKEEMLGSSLGDKAGGNDGWYRISGHDETGYLIQEVNGEYSLWKFSCFVSDEYPYSDVLRIVFGVESADAIRSVTVRPAKMDNTDEGRRIQEEIGTHIITDVSDIDRLYTILSGMTCYGSNRWDFINYGQSDNGMLDAVRNGRYLTISLKNGCVIENLNYSAIGGMFYEFGGVAYNVLPTEEKKAVDAILGIEYSADGTQADGGLYEIPADDSLVNTEKISTSETAADAPAEENTYQEAHRYPDEVESIQAAISKAMCDGKLPFVISSAICENPVRVEVTVNTQDAELIQAVFDYDTAGGMIEVVYSDSAPVLE